MGCSSSHGRIFSQLQKDTEQNANSITSSRHWFRVRSEQETYSELEADGTIKNGFIDQVHLELRALLDYPIGKEFLLVQSKRSAPFAEICLNGWLDIQSFNAMVDGPAKVTMAHSIHQKYVSDSMIVSLAEQDRIKALLKLPPDKIVSGIFDEIKSQMFNMLCDHMFVNIRETREYKVMCATLRRKYNRVAQNDFWYHQLIGQGGFGLVAEVSKKTTGIRYAMKLLRKDHLAQIFGEEPWRVEIEKRAFASCRHPFIVELHFAFQTESLVAMVMSLGTGRDLSKILRTNGPLTIEQVTFYAAEATSALSYLHEKGLVYRDLKPANILLDLDGHIQLVDFGGVCDMNGKLIASCKNVGNGVASVFSDHGLKMNTQPPLSVYWSQRTETADCHADVTPKSNGLCLEGPIVVRTDSKSGPGLLLDTEASVGAVTNSVGHVSQTQPLAKTQAREQEPLVLDQTNVSWKFPSGPDIDRMIKGRRKTCSSTDLSKLQQKFYELSDSKILRHFLMCDCDYDRTVANIEQMMLWRQSFFTFSDKPMNPSTGPGCCFFSHGYDSEGHPLLVFTSRLLDLKTPNFEQITKWILYMFEVAIESLPPHLEQFTILSNRLGSTSNSLQMAALFFPLIEKYYPNCVYNMLMYPVSMTIKTIGGVVKKLAGKQANKLYFVKSLEQLKEYIPNEYIPVELGGVCNYEFNINDYPPPIVCEPYQYCLQNFSQQLSPDDSPAQLPVALADNSWLETGGGGGVSSIAGSGSGSIDASTHGSYDGGTFHQVLPDSMVSSNGSRSTGKSNNLLKTRPPLRRSNSIVGTYSYMAPEMIILMVDVQDTGFTHTGYTKAVDWWSLGVTIYRLLTGLYPFETDIPNPTTQEARSVEGSERYCALLQDVNYRMFGDNHPHVVDIISQLLTVDDTERLGYGPDGSNAVSAHKFFADINWVELEQKKTKPPPVPNGCTSHRRLGYRGPMGLDQLLHMYDKVNWIDSGKGTMLNMRKKASDAGPVANAKKHEKSKAQIERENVLTEQLQHWDYTSPSAVLAELEYTSGASSLITTTATVPGTGGTVAGSGVHGIGTGAGALNGLSLRKTTEGGSEKVID